MRVLLVYPNGNKEIIGWGDLGAIAEPLALEYVSAVANLGGHEVRGLDLRLHPEDLDKAVGSFRPDVVGVTGYSMHVLRNLAICQRVKEILPDCKTVVGGHHATLLPEDFFEPQIDYVVVGDGMRPFEQILDILAQGGTVESLPGVWASADDMFHYGGPSQPFDFTRIPQPDRSLFAEDTSFYFIDWMKPIALLRTSVGCPYRCSFCSLWKIMDGLYHKRDAAAVVEDIQQIPARYVFLVDDEPFVDPRRMKMLAEYIRDAGVDKEYFAYCRVDSFLRDRDLMELWRDVGLRRVFFGIETIFEYELRDYNKRQKLGQTIQALRTAREMGIGVFSNFIISPAYTAAEFDEIVEFIRKYDVEYPSFTILTPIPGTESGSTFDKVIERQPNGRPNWDYYDLQHPVTETKLPKDEFMSEYRNLYRAFARNRLAAEHPFYQNLDRLNLLHAGLSRHTQREDTGSFAPGRDEPSGQ